MAENDEKPAVIDKNIIQTFIKELGRDNFASLAQDYVDEMRRSYRDLTQFMSGPADKIERLAHNIKGSAATVGLMVLQKAAFELELAAKKNEQSMIPPMIKYLGHYLDEAVTALELAIQKKPL